MENNTPKNSRVNAVILAAGMGKRMGGNKLKVMYELNGRPFIDYVVSSVEESLPGQKPTVIVCEQDSSVQDFLGDRAQYVIQRERLGTGHAVQTAEDFLRNQGDYVLVLYGDMPFISAESIKKLLTRHQERQNTITLMTVITPDFEGWRACLYDYGRIIRGDDGHIVRSVEKRDATPEELQIQELNPCIYCFKADWLWKNLKNIQNDNAQKEYYLTEVIRLAIEAGEKLSAIHIPPEEAVGINNPDQYSLAQTLIKNT